MRSLTCKQQKEILDVAKRNPIFRGLSDDQILRHLVQVNDYGGGATARLQRGSDVLNIPISCSAVVAG
jgi:hypothetical protein